MGLLQKIREWRANHKIVKAIVDGATAFAAGNVGATVLEQLVETPVVTEARADFYDGVRGPRRYQLDQRLIVNSDKEKLSYVLLPKIFLDRDKNGRGIFGVGIFDYTTGDEPSVGGGVGGFYAFGNMSVLGVVPVVYSMEGESVMVNPTVYATSVVGPILLDSRISYAANFSEEGDTHSIHLGGTLGFKIFNAILGLDLSSKVNATDLSTKQIWDNLQVQGIVRMDFDSEHKYWLQAYVGDKYLGIGFRWNFGPN